MSWQDGIYLFRPLPHQVITSKYYGRLCKYLLNPQDDALWGPDDGEPGMAFVGLNGPPMAYYVDVPHRRSHLYSWWSETPCRERNYRGGSWHYQYINDKESEYRGSALDGEWHLNAKMGRAAMDFCCGHKSCANGSSVSLTDLNDPHIKDGLVWRLNDRGKLEKITRPPLVKCSICHLQFAVTKKGIELTNDYFGRNFEVYDIQ